MKRQLIPLIIVLPLMGAPSSLEVYAQDPTGALPGTKPNTTTSSASRSSGGKSSRTGSATAPAPVILPLNIGEETKGKLDPRSSEKNTDGSFYQEMILNAKAEDSLSFHIEGDNPLLGLQILDKRNGDVEVPVMRDQAGDFKIATGTGGVPADGEYRVRVTGVLIGKNPVPFTIKVNRLGLTSIAYNERFNSIFTNYNENDPASVEATVAQLEALAQDSPLRSTAFELLGRIYLDPIKDLAKAEAALDHAIKAKGVAVIKISFDSQWRRLEKSKSGEYAFEDARWGWLKIGQGQITITDPVNKQLASLNGMQIKELSKNLISAYSMVTIVAENARKPYIFSTKRMASDETDLIVKLIQNHVSGKAY